MTTSPSGFAALGVPDDLCARLDAAGITAPFPIQTAVIPDALAGRDVTGRAPTGSGKTLGFGIPVIARMTKATRRKPTALVLAPTRELAEQIATELRPLARSRRFDVVSVYGGVGYGPQRKALDAGVELLVACPGRLEDLIKMGVVQLGNVTQVVVDEADRMADMGFLPSVKRILDQTSKDRQVLLFSATLDGTVATLARATQRNPVRHEVGPEGPDITAATHVFWEVERVDRPNTTAAIVKALGSTMVFCRTPPRRRPPGPAARQARRQRGADPRRTQPAPARPGAALVQQGRGVRTDRHRRRRPRCPRRGCRRGRALRRAGRLVDLRPPLRPHGARRCLGHRRVADRPRRHPRRPQDGPADRHRRARHRRRSPPAQAGRRRPGARAGAPAQVRTTRPAARRRPRRAARPTSPMSPCSRRRPAARSARSRSSTVVGATGSSTAAPARTCSCTTRTSRPTASLTTGQRVEFAVRAGTKGPEAIDVVLV